MIPSDIIKNRDTIVLAIIEFATGAGKSTIRNYRISNISDANIANP